MGLAGLRSATRWPVSITLALLALLAIGTNAHAATHRSLGALAPPHWVQSTGSSAKSKTTVSPNLAVNGPGYVVQDWSSTGGTVLRDAPSYTLRLVSNGQGDVEQLRSAAQFAASQIASISGVQVSVAAGTVPDGATSDRTPTDGEILLSVDSTVAGSPACGSGPYSLSWAGCTMLWSQRAYPEQGFDEIRSSRMWIHPVTLGYSTADQRSVISHELGHALGLDHYETLYNGVYQVMNGSGGGYTTQGVYQDGDKNGLRFLVPQQRPKYMSVTSGSIGYVQTPPYSATGWGPIINYPGGLTFARPASGDEYVEAISDPGGDGSGGLFFQSGSFTPTWLPIAPQINNFAITANASNGVTTVGVDAATEILYFMNAPFSASGWQAIANNIDRLAVTSPVSGGSTVFARDASSHVLYFMDTPFSATGWHAMANSIDQVVATSPSSGGEVAAMVDENTHKLYYQTSPFTATWTYAGIDDVQSVVASRSGNGSARLGVIKTDGTASVSTYPFTVNGWKQISPFGWTIKKMTMSGNTIGLIRDVGGNTGVAAFATEPFTQAPADWHDVANWATDMGLDETGR